MINIRLSLIIIYMLLIISCLIERIKYILFIEKQSFKIFYWLLFRWFNCYIYI